MPIRIDVGVSVVAISLPYLMTLTITTTATSANLRWAINNGGSDCCCLSSKWRIFTNLLFHLSVLFPVCFELQTPDDKWEGTKRNAENGEE